MLVETSVWSLALRRDAPAQSREVEALGAAVERGVVCLTGAILQEVLQGFDREDLYRKARTAMWAFPIVESPLSLGVVEDAIELYRRARRAGLTVRSSVDCLIAACAIRHDLTVLHADRDFGALARVSQLRERDVAA